MWNCVWFSQKVDVNHFKNGENSMFTDDEIRELAELDILPDDIFTDSGLILDPDWDDG